MSKTNHTFFLQLLDNVLEALNNESKNYTLSYQELFDSIEPKIGYETIYQNQFEKLLLGGYDKYIESKNKPYLLNSTLQYLIKEDYVFRFETAPKQNSFQITHKGFLKIHSGFEKDYKNEIKKIEATKREKIFDKVVSIIKIVWPVIAFALGFILKQIFDCSSVN